MSTRTRSPLLAVIVIGVLIAAAGVTYEEAKSQRWVTFDVRLGDGYSWAGSAKIVYVIGDVSRPAILKAKPQGDHSVNTWTIKKQIHPPVALALSATPDWPGKPVQVVIRGQGISARPVKAVGPQTAAFAAYVAGP